MVEKFENSCGARAITNIPTSMKQERNWCSCRLSLTIGLKQYKSVAMDIVQAKFLLKPYWERWRFPLSSYYERLKGVSILPIFLVHLFTGSECTLISPISVLSLQDWIKLQNLYHTLHQVVETKLATQRALWARRCGVMTTVERRPWRSNW